LRANRILVCGGGLLLLASALRSQQSGDGPPRAWAHITYLTLSSAYVDAGTAEGLADGARLDVRRGDSTIAVLRAHFVATHKAVCEIVLATAPLAVGDSARFTPTGPTHDSIPAVARRATPATGAQRRSGALRGRVGLFYLSVRPLDGSGAMFAQPSGDVRLMGSDLGGSGLGLLADVRSRRMVQTRADGLGTDAQDQTRVYQAALSWQAPGSPVRLAAGRQFAPGIPAVGLVDGLSARLELRDWSGGVFAGTQPEPVNLGFSGTVTQLGAALARHSRSGDPTAWSVTTGVSGSYVHGAANREFLYVQGEYGTPRLSLYAAQEIDYYRPWRRVGGERALSPTSTFATVRVRVAAGFSVTAGVDNRRNVRLYRDVVNPETVFDDAFRRGVWAGLSTRLGPHVQASLDARTNRGGTTGPVDSYTLVVGATPSSPMGVTLRSRSTRYTTTGRAGWLQSLAVGLEPWGRSDLELSGGWRLERDRTPGTTTSLRWLSADADVDLARAWYVMLSAYREWGGVGAYALVSGGLSYRF
jgi:hypothetical protein